MVVSALDRERDQEHARVVTVLADVCTVGVAARNTRGLPVSGDFLNRLYPREGRNGQVQATRRRLIDAITGHTVREFMEVLAHRRIEHEAAARGIYLSDDRMIELSDRAVRIVLEEQDLGIADAVDIVLDGEDGEEPVPFEPEPWEDDIDDDVEPVWFW